jgi:hypothetical protein
MPSKKRMRILLALAGSSFFPNIGAQGGQRIRFPTRCGPTGEREH